MTLPVLAFYTINPIQIGLLRLANALSHTIEKRKKKRKEGGFDGPKEKKLKKHRPIQTKGTKSTTTGLGKQKRLKVKFLLNLLITCRKIRCSWYQVPRNDTPDHRGFFGDQTRKRERSQRFKVCMFILQTELMSYNSVQ